MAAKSDSHRARATSSKQKVKNLMSYFTFKTTVSSKVTVSKEDTPSSKLPVSSSKQTPHSSPNRITPNRVITSPIEAEKMYTVSKKLLDNCKFTGSSTENHTDVGGVSKSVEGRSASEISSKNMTKDPHKSSPLTPSQSLSNLERSSDRMSVKSPQAKGPPKKLYFGAQGKSKSPSLPTTKSPSYRAQQSPGNSPKSPSLPTTKSPSFRAQQSPGNSSKGELKSKGNVFQFALSKSKPKVNSPTPASDQFQFVLKPPSSKGEPNFVTVLRGELNSPTSKNRFQFTPSKDNPKSTFPREELGSKARELKSPTSRGTPSTKGQVQFTPTKGKAKPEAASRGESRTLTPKGGGDSVHSKGMSKSLSSRGELKSPTLSREVVSSTNLNSLSSKCEPKSLSRQLLGIVPIATLPQASPPKKASLQASPPKKASLLLKERSPRLLQSTLIPSDLSRPSIEAFRCNRTLYEDHSKSPVGSKISPSLRCVGHTSSSASPRNMLSPTKIGSSSVPLGSHTPTKPSSNTSLQSSPVNISKTHSTSKPASDSSLSSSTALSKTLTPNKPLFSASSSSPVTSSEPSSLNRPASRTLNSSKPLTTAPSKTHTPSKPLPWSPKNSPKTLPLTVTKSPLPENNSTKPLPATLKRSHVTNKPPQSKNSPKHSPVTSNEPPLPKPVSGDLDTTLSKASFPNKPESVLPTSPKSSPASPSAVVRRSPLSLKKSPTHCKRFSVVAKSPRTPVRSPLDICQTSARKIISKRSPKSPSREYHFKFSEAATVQEFAQEVPVKDVLRPCVDGAKKKPFTEQLAGKNSEFQSAAAASGQLDPSTTSGGSPAKSSAGEVKGHIDGPSSDHLPRKRILSDSHKSGPSKRRCEYHESSRSKRRRSEGHVRNERCKDSDITILSNSNEVITLYSPRKVKRPRFFSDTRCTRPSKKKCVVDLTKVPLPPESHPCVIDLTVSPDISPAMVKTERVNVHSSHSLSIQDLDLTPELPSISRHHTFSSSNSSTSSQKSATPRRTLFQSGEKTPPLRTTPALLPSSDQPASKASRDTTVLKGASCSSFSNASDGLRVGQLADFEGVVDGDGLKSRVAWGSVGGEAAVAAGKATEVDQDIKPKSLLSRLDEGGVSKQPNVDSPLLSSPKKSEKTWLNEGGGNKQPQLDLSLLSALNQIKCCTMDLPPDTGGVTKLPCPSPKQPGPSPVSEKTHPLLSDVFQPGWKGTPIQEVRIVMAGRGLASVQEMAKNVRLLSSAQNSMLENRLDEYARLSSYRLCCALEHMKMVMHPFKMPRGSLLAQIWELMLKSQELLAQSEVKEICELYLEQLLSTHPPGQHELVDQEYAHFVKTLEVKGTFGLWEHVESLLKLQSFLGTFLVDLLLVDFWATLTSRGCSSSAPLFMQVFWVPGGSNGHVTRPIRRLLELATQLVCSRERSKEQDAHLRNMMVLLYLANTVCSDLTTELVLTCNRLPTPHLLHFLSLTHSTSVRSRLLSSLPALNQVYSTHMGTQDGAGKVEEKTKSASSSDELLKVKTLQHIQLLCQQVKEGEIVRSPSGTGGLRKVANLPSNQGNKSRPSQGSKTLPSQGGKDRPTQGNKSRPTQGNKDHPTLGIKTLPTQGKKTLPAQDRDHPTQGIKTLPTQGDKDHPTLGIKTLPTQGDKSHPIQGIKTLPIQGDKDHPTLGIKTLPTQGDKSHPIQGIKTLPIQGDKDHPTLGNKTLPTQGNKGHRNKDHPTTLGNKTLPGFSTSETGQPRVDQESNQLTAKSPSSTQARAMSVDQTDTSGLSIKLLSGSRVTVRPMKSSRHSNAVIKRMASYVKYRHPVDKVQGLQKSAQAVAGPGGLNTVQTVTLANKMQSMVCSKKVTPKQHKNGFYAMPCLAGPSSLNKVTAQTLTSAGKMKYLAGSSGSKKKAAATKTQQKKQTNGFYTILSNHLQAAQNTHTFSPNTLSNHCNLIARQVHKSEPDS